MSPVSDFDGAQSRESPSRYQRSFAGMIGALIVTLVVIAGFVLFRALDRDNLELQPEPVDWEGTVEYIQSQGEVVWYPATQPAGWTATSADYKPGTLWRIGFLTDDGHFVGLHEEAASIRDLVAELVDDEATEGAAVQLAGRSWRSFSDTGGDFALVAELDDRTLVAYGSAGPQVIRDFAASLTDRPVPS